MKAVCKHCGCGEIFRNATASVSGWVDIEITYDEKGLSHSEGDFETLDHHYDIEDYDDFQCNNCRKSARKLSDLVAQQDETHFAGLCACGHTLDQHRTDGDFDPKVYTRSLYPCEEACACRDFEPDPALARVVHPSLLGAEAA